MGESGTLCLNARRAPASLSSLRGAAPRWSVTRHHPQRIPPPHRARTGPAPPAAPRPDTTGRPRAGPHAAARTRPGLRKGPGCRLRAGNGPSAGGCARGRPASPWPLPGHRSRRGRRWRERARGLLGRAVKLDAARKVGPRERRSLAGSACGPRRELGAAGSQPIAAAGAGTDP